MADVTLTIDGIEVTVPEDTTIMEAADQVGLRIPRLCYHPELSIAGACRVCIVEVEGMRNLPASCCFPVADGMVVHTHSPEVLRLRRDIVELLLDNHPTDCNSCERDGNCELQRLAYAMGIRERLFEGDRKRYEKDLTGPSILRDPEKCILCGRCVRVCGEIQEVAALGQVFRGFDTVVMPAHDAPAAETVCINCGQCVNVCPTAAFLEIDGCQAVVDAIEDPDVIVVSQDAPSIRAAIGETQGLPPGQAMEGEIVAALRRMGVDYVLDTQFGADLTIVEEAAEFVQRFTQGGAIPNITSCCPGWVKYCEQFHPDMMQYLSSARSPMSMQSPLIKTYWAERMGIDPEKIFSVAIMPCTAKKFEAERPELFVDGMQCTDAVLTTREFGWLIQHMGIDFAHIQPEEPDSLIGASSGAAALFGATGGVTEAALRTAYWMVLDKELPDEGLVFEQTRGLDGVREAWLDLEGTKLHIVIAHGLSNANIVLDRLRSGEEIHWIEIMACPGGCIGGGGQPYAGTNAIPLDKELLAKRAGALYQLDAERAIRKSHLNPEIQQLYKDYLGEPLGEKSHHLLHTHYHARVPFGIRPQEAQSE